MGCCFSKEAPEDLYRKAPNKSCTDVICYIIFLIYLCGLSIIAVFCYETGAFHGTWYGYDHLGNACGFDNTKFVSKKVRQILDTATSSPEILHDHSDKPKKFCFNYENLGQIFLDTTQQTKCICIKQCPTLEDIQQAKQDMNNQSTEPHLENSKVGRKTFKKLEENMGQQLCMYDFNQKYQSNSSYSKIGPCPLFDAGPEGNSSSIFTGYHRKGGAIIDDTIDIFNRCVDSRKINVLSEMASLVSSLDFIHFSITNLVKDQNLVYQALLLAIGLSFILTLSFQFIAPIAAWLITIGTGLIVWGSAAILWMAYLQSDTFLAVLKTANWPDQIYSKIEQLVQQDKNYLLWIAVVSTLIASVITLFLFCMQERNEVSVGIMQEGSHVLNDSPLLYLVPVVTVVILLLFWIMWLFLMITVNSSYLKGVENIGDLDQIARSGEVATKTSIIEVGQISETAEEIVDNLNQWINNTDENLQHFSPFFQYYVLFSVFWISEWILAVSYMIIAGTAIRIWNRNLNPKSEQCGLIKTVGQILFYHVGSAAFGSFLITLIQIPRAILLFIQSRTKNTDNRYLKYIYCCIQCLLACFEKCLRSLTKTAYVFVVADYNSFLTAASRAVNLLLKNVLQAASLEGLTWLTTMLAQLFVAFASTMFLVFRLYGNLSNYVNDIQASINNGV